MKQIVFNFMRCGFLGWCLEILFTSYHSYRQKDYTLKATTSLWMFPIYGFIAFLSPLFDKIKNINVILRGSLYSFIIFFGEYLFGTILKKFGVCPWNYSNAKWNYQSVIRLDYFPLWFFTGLLFEKSFKQ